VIDYVSRWTARSEVPAKQILSWMGLPTSKYHLWRHHYGRPHAHNSHIPRDGWLEAWEKQAIIDFHRQFPLEGYRRLTYMMLDHDVVAASPSSVYRVLKGAGLLDRNRWAPSKKGTGFVQPLKAHDHWHVDISYLNLAGTFYFLCSVLDGYSRAIVHWEIRETMKEPEVETIVQRALEKHPGAKPRIISDNGPQFIAKDFKTFIRLTGITHVRTSPYYPQSNGKIERWHATLKNEHFRAKSPQSLEEARKVVDDFVTHYNEVRLHSGLGYIAPIDKLAGREKDICDSRDRKLEAARAKRLGARSRALAETAQQAVLI
jgi:putative transposase